MKVAVTSASGQLGGAIIRALIEEIGAEQVVGIARTPAKAADLGVEIRPGDYNEKRQFVSALQGIDAVLLVSGMDAPDRRIQQHRNVIEAAVECGVSKIVYTSIVGDPEQTTFAPVIQSNRQTEQDVQSSGLSYVIGRNGIYIEPDLEYIDQYVADGEIKNCAALGRCGYTSRPELAYAYTQMLIDTQHDGHIYHLLGEAITQAELADLINEAYGTSLSYRSMTVEQYREDRQAELGDFLGTVIAGIYEGIQRGVQDIPSDYSRAAGRPHLSPREMIRAYQAEH